MIILLHVMMIHHYALKVLQCITITLHFGVIIIHNDMMILHCFMIHDAYLFFTVILYDTLIYSLAFPLSLSSLSLSFSLSFIYEILATSPSHQRQNPAIYIRLNF